MAGKIRPETGGKLKASLVLVICIAGALALLWYRVDAWQHYRREIKRPEAAQDTLPAFPSVEFSRFTAAELKAGHLNAFQMGKKREDKAGKPLSTEIPPGDGYEIVGVVKRGEFILVVRRQPGNRLAWLRAGDEISPGLTVETISTTRASIRKADGSLREHRVFELKEFPAGELAKRSRQ